jgi:hypothetical protein
VGSSRRRIGFGADVKGNDRRRQIHSARALPACQSTGETSTVESDAVPSGAFLMRKWIGERDYRLMKSGPFRDNLSGFTQSIARARPVIECALYRLNETVLVAPA